MNAKMFNMARRFVSSDSTSQMMLANLTFGNMRSSGTPLILVPGLFGTKENWIRVGKELSQRLGCMVFAVENRNHGGSSMAPSMTYPEMADDLVGFIDWVRKITGEKQVNLHGHSMGGKTVTQLATTPEYAPRIKNLIVEDMSPLGYPLKRAEYLDCIKHMIATDMNKSRDEVMAELGEKVSKVLLYQFVRGNLGEDVNGKAQWTCNLNVIDETYIYLLSHDIRFGVFEGPTLFQRASGSGFLPASHKNRVEKMFPMVKFAETAWSNHWIHADDPKFFVDSICDFLEEPKELGELGRPAGI
ncbi:unnamed protein product [Caenorhabditis nigoni]